MKKDYTYVLKKAPFSCGVVGKVGMCVGIPNKLKRYKKITVVFAGFSILEITEFHKQAIAHRHMPDKWNGGTFLMSYFKVDN